MNRDLYRAGASLRRKEKNMELYRSGVKLLRRTQEKRIKFMLLNVILPSIRSRLVCI